MKYFLTILSLFYIIYPCDDGYIEINNLCLTSLSKQFETKSSFSFGLFDLKERYLGTLVIDYVKTNYTLTEEQLTYARQKAAAIGSTISSYLSN